LKTSLAQNEDALVINYPSHQIAKIPKKPMVVIIVNDDILTQLLQEAYARQGFDVITRSLGQDAIDYFAKFSSINTKCLVILDRLLLDMDGLQVMKTIKKKFSSKLLFIFITDKSSEKDILEGLAGRVLKLDRMKLDPI